MALLIWAAVAASLVAWGARWLQPSSPTPAQAQVATDRALPPADWSRPLGATLSGAGGTTAGGPEGAVAQRPLTLVGVIAAARQGVALIAAGADSARAYRLGAVVEGQWTLRTIEPRAVTLVAREGGEYRRLELPPLPTASVAASPTASLSVPPAVSSAPTAPAAPAAVMTPSAPLAPATGPSAQK